MVMSSMKQATNTEYENFQAIRKATKLITIYDDMNSCEFHKMVQTGELDHHDYGVGFLNFRTCALKIKDSWQVRIYIANIDDGDFGGWSEPMEKSKALKLVKSVAENVMKDMIVFPSKDKLNAVLREYGLFVDHE